MLVKTYDQTGKELSQTRLPAEVFGIEINHDLVHQVVVSQMANRRQIIAHTKDRGEVSGGGRKPWRQKGTGRARHGSIRSPLWRHGGVTFGPTKERVFKKKINTKMKRGALLMVLSEKAKNNFLILLDKLELENAKTKLMAKILEKLPIKGGIKNLGHNLYLCYEKLVSMSLVDKAELSLLEAWLEDLKQIGLSSTTESTASLAL